MTGVQTCALPIYAEVLGLQIDNPLSPDAWIARLATLPLIDQPGTGFHYGLSTDLLGFLIARLDGAPLGAVLERRIFAPLGMRDTCFTVPAAKRDRCAGLCGFDSEGRPTALTAVPGRHALSQRPDGMTFESGSGGLWSTLERLRRRNPSNETIHLEMRVPGTSDSTLNFVPIDYVVGGMIEIGKRPASIGSDCK